MQRIPADSGVQGNRRTDRLSSEGDQLDQEGRYTSYTDEKTLIITLSKKNWKQQHQNSKQSYSLRKLNKPEQVVLFRLPTEHNRLNAHNVQRVLLLLHFPAISLGFTILVKIFEYVTVCLFVCLFFLSSH